MYDNEIADEIIERVGEGETLLRVCNHDREGLKRVYGEFPRPSTIYHWCNVTDNRYHPEFCARYAEAMEAQERVWLDEVIDIADTPEMGEETTEEEVEGTTPTGTMDKTVKRTVKKEMFSHRALRINTRFNALKMRNPRLWADKGDRAKADNDREIEVHGGLYD